MYSSNHYSPDITMCAADSIPISKDKGGGDEGFDPNSFGIIPIGCQLISSGTILAFSFYDDLGFVDVTVTNLSTSEIVSDVINTQLGFVLFPISGNPGFYYIQISTSSGDSYHGQFII